MSQFAYTPIQNEDYRVNTIKEDKFSSWTQENLYRTSYASSYRDVLDFPFFHPFRNHTSLKTASSLATPALFPELSPEPSSVEALPKLLRAVSMTPSSQEISSDSAAQGTRQFLY
jgi:hypothetical protein